VVLLCLSLCGCSGVWINRVQCQKMKWESRCRWRLNVWQRIYWKEIKKKQPHLHWAIQCTGQACVARLARHILETTFLLHSLITTDSHRGKCTEKWRVDGVWFVMNEKEDSDSPNNESKIITLHNSLLSYWDTNWELIWPNKPKRYSISKNDMIMNLWWWWGGWP